MTSRERLKKVLNREIPDCVPVAPDTSNMIPVRMTGKSYWDIYLYKNPPIWKAYLDCVEYFGFDSLMDGYASILFDELGELGTEWTEVIVKKNKQRIITQKFKTENHKKIWSESVTVYFVDNPPSNEIKPQSIGLSPIPSYYEPIENIQPQLQGEELLEQAKQIMGDKGLIGVFCGTSKLLGNEHDIYDFYDNPNKYYKIADRLLSYYEKRLHKLMSLNTKPDFICTGSSGTLVTQSPEIFRELGLPIVKRITKLCKEYNIPSHLHSCGPEKELVKMTAEETDLTIIDPLEISPMGDCNLKDLKEKYGDKLVLKGNLHTTKVMLHGTPDDVINASKKAIDDAAGGGGFILSTGDQCGRDTSDENIFAMIETARTYGRY